MTSVDTADTVLKDDEETPKKWVPRVITGGKGPPKAPEGHNWLSELPRGTTFVCRHKNNQDVDLNLYHVVFKDDNVVLLAWRLPDGKMLDYHVDPVRFSQKFEHVTILGDQPVDNEEDDNGSQRQCDHSGSPDVVLHEAVQGVDPVVSEPERPDLSPRD